ncbi:SusD/RagB family nutrient-binding outer membrane lipoprotein [Winogradskyella aurantiaca]|uniref:SusD/RagB family nutrient-binding outer membrane lipoprotein n=1 Tax=Winogradskyella aurantiaca TaxID=2219558 RepID=UPI000E1DF5B4|nr:SusD/RagB family nutrient-binding outer membrane lipoprotein [Winogradskyella aurantiaca]
MKKLIKYTAIFIVLASYISCETTDLDLRTNPNALSPEQADPNSLLNNIQLEFIDAIDGNGDGFGRVGAELSRIDYMFGRNYTNNYSPSDFDDEWQSTYADMMADIRVLTPLAEEANFTHHLGIAKTLEAYLLITLVDFFGDVPYSEAIQGIANPNPKLDTGEEVYNSALALLDEAIANFESDASAEPTSDFFYSGNTDKWIKAVNTIKLKIYVQTRLVDANAVSNFNTIINNGNYISSSDDDFQFNGWGTNEVQPDVRHPRYSNSYTVTGGEDYMSNWLMSYMLNNNDPRIRYYFYRQVNATPGTGTDPNEETLQCSVQDVPVHYLGTPFENIWCSLPNGYWGRIHGNNEGIPPDGFLRTLAGVYPAGGAFDDDRFEALSQGDGAAGLGAITPLILASTVSFYQAEMAMVNNSPLEAKSFLLDGLAKSVTKVTSFGSFDTTADLSIAPTAQDIASHAADIEAKFDSASTEDQWNIIGEEFFTNLYGNGIDGYNFYRRTGFPNTVPPNIEPNPGAFIRSLFYPANFVNNNSNATQKAAVTEQVFWDTNPASPGFPIAN